jgi:hypothetical protein
LIRVQLPLRCVPEPWAVWSSGTGCHPCCSLFLSLGTPLGGQPTWACHIRTACVSGAIAFALWALVLTRARTPPTGLRWPSRRAAGALSHGDDIVPRLIGKKSIWQHGSLHQGASGPHTEHPALILITAQCPQQKSKDLQHAGLAKGNLVLSAGDGSIDGQPPTVTIPRSGHAFWGGPGAGRCTVLDQSGHSNQPSRSLGLQRGRTPSARPGRRPRQDHRRDSGPPHITFAEGP